MRGGVAEDLSASEEDLCCMQLVSALIVVMRSTGISKMLGKILYAIDVIFVDITVVRYGVIL
jgi:hypothetical protein